MQKLSLGSLSKIGTVSGIVLAALFLAGCNVAQQAQNTVSQAAQQAVANAVTEADFAKITDPLVRKNFVAQANTRTFRTVTTNSNKMAGTTTAEIQFTGTTMALHTITEIGGKSQEMIILGDTTYVKDPSTGTWWKQVSASPVPSSAPTNFKMPTPDEMKQQLADKQNSAEFKQLGTEACGTLTCYKYQEADNGDAANAKTIWFDNQQYLTRQTEEKIGGGTITTVYSYDKISITAPSPTQDVPAGHSAFEYMMGAPTGAPTETAPKTTGAVPPTAGKMPTQAEIDDMMKQAQSAQQGQ